ncbi:MAG: universal stress protein [Nitrospirota bacterium]|nr:universal stress protein [Nitrospirota bacterium]
MKIKKILVPTDFSEGARPAMDYAISLAKDYKAGLCILHVIQELTVTPGWYEGVIPMESLYMSIEEGATGEMDRLMSETDLPDVEKVISRGYPAAEILRTAQERGVDLIVIGTHGRSGVDHLLFGSTAEKVVRQAPCPVLTVRISPSNT